MSAFFVALIRRIKDHALFDEYAAKSAASFQAHGGEVVARGPLIEMLSATKDAPVATAVVAFPTQQALFDWHSSDEYQSIIELRKRAADIEFGAYAVPETA